MGCRTGFYLVVFGELTSEEILPLVRELFEFVADFEGDVPGAAPEECGNYLDQNLPMLTGSRAATSTAIWPISTRSTCIISRRKALSPKTCALGAFAYAGAPFC